MSLELLSINALTNSDLRPLSKHYNAACGKLMVIWYVRVESQKLFSLEY